MEYQEWNKILAEYFFNPEQAGREVLLYVTDELINRLGAPFGCGVDDFISAVKDDRPARDFCTHALELFHGWREKGLQYPPYVGMLSVLVLSDVSSSEDIVAHSYYPKLWSRLGEVGGKGQLPGFEELDALWDDLEKWSRVDKGEELGRFVARIRGGRINIGLPRSQTLLSDHERNMLPKLFSEAGLEPGDPPNGEALAALLQSCRQVVLVKCLYARTAKLLFGNGGDPNLREALLELISEELETWDGQVEGENETERGYTRQALRIAIEDLGGPFNGALKARFRIWSRTPFPEDQLTFNYKDQAWTCAESAAGWSEPVRLADPANWRFLEPDEDAWAGNIQLVDEGLNWRARQRKTDVRLFRKGGFDIPVRGWLEVPRLSREMEFLVAADKDQAPSVMEWGSGNCKSFSEVTTAGLPGGWRIFQGKNPRKSHPDIPILKVSTQFRLRLIGGIKPRRGNTYLSFAPPEIVVENMPSGGVPIVELDGKALPPCKDSSNRFACPPHLLPGKVYQVNARTGEGELKTLFHLVEPEINDLNTICPCRMADGTIASADATGPMVQGAFVKGTIPASTSEIQSWPLLLKNLRDGVLLGRSPDQVWWHDDTFEPSWQPVWAIIKAGAKNFEAAFCRASVDEECDPVGNGKHQSNNDRHWREFLWVKRERISVSGPATIVKLWKAYQEVAKNV